MTRKVPTHSVLVRDGRRLLATCTACSFVAALSLIGSLGIDRHESAHTFKYAAQDTQEGCEIDDWSCALPGVLCCSPPGR